MAYGQEIEDYKLKIAHDLLSDNEIVSCIEEVIPEEKKAELDGLMYSYIFPYVFIPQTLQDVGCYICFELYVPCHQDVMRTSGGYIRTDHIAHLIEKIFNQNDQYTFKKLDLVSSVPGHVTQTHRCRTVRFVAEDLNVKPPDC